MTTGKTKDIVTARPKMKRLNQKDTVIYHGLFMENHRKSDENRLAAPFGMGNALARYYGVDFGRFLFRQ